MKEMKVTYSLKEDGDRCNITRKMQGVSDSELQEAFSLILADMITVFKENGTPKESTQAMMNEIVDMVYRMHPKHTKIQSFRKEAQMIGDGYETFLK